ncbi:Hypothetical predicted protein [Mytilus galloprovincialis]|uniref:Histone H4 n=1 Tax=Mytilus galloprovincialis TaxID=29158 RepID=A0A8B6DS45_MYTGA|nr:Hypothetical predicted protein [Mytilus galloprovincialis]
MEVNKESNRRNHSGKGLGGNKRQRKQCPCWLPSKPSIRRLARRGGVKRISGLVYAEIRGVLRVYLQHVLHDTIVYTDHAKRKTVTASDVIHAVRHQGCTLYGLDCK